MTLSILSEKALLKVLQLKNYASTLNTLIVVIIVLELIGETFLFQPLMQLKPVPLILLILKSILIVDCNHAITKALVFSLVGDILLMINTLYFFELGTISFLLGHICYISAFWKDFQFQRPNTRLQKYFAVLTTMAIMIFWAWNNFVLWQVMPHKVIFPLYAIILSGMASSSLYRFKEIRTNNYICGVIGALMFMISDVIIAHTKLKKGEESALDGLIIMILYYTGQSLILKGNSKQRVKISQN